MGGGSSCSSMMPKVACETAERPPSGRAIKPSWATRTTACVAWPNSRAPAARVHIGGPVASFGTTTSLPTKSSARPFRARTPSWSPTRGCGDNTYARERSPQRKGNSGCGDRATGTRPLVRAGRRLGGVSSKPRIRHLPASNDGLMPLHLLPTLLSTSSSAGHLCTRPYPASRPSSTMTPSIVLVVAHDHRRPGYWRDRSVECG